MTLPQLYLRLLKKLAPYGRPLLYILFAMLILAASMAYLPLLIEKMLASIFVLKDLSLVQQVSLTIIALFVVRWIFGYISIYYISTISGKLGTDLRMDFFHRLVSLPVNYYAYLNHNNQIDTLVSHISRITQTTVRHIAQLVQDCLSIMGLLICALYLNQEFSLLLLLVTPFIILVHEMIRSYFSKTDQHNLLTLRDLIGHITQSVKHYRKIRLDGGQADESQRLGRISETLFHTEMQSAKIVAMAIPTSQLIAALMLTAVTYIMALQATNNTLSLSEAGALIAIALLLIFPLRRIASIPRELEHDRKMIEATFSFLDLAPEQDIGTLSIQQIRGKLVFEQIRLNDSIQTKPILSHINLTIKPSEVIVIKGYTETEKNVLIDLILRLRQPSNGRILLDEYSLDKITINQIYRNISLVSTDPFLLDERIAGNIAYGAMRCANEAKITAAAHASHAMEFIRRMPEGLQTQINNDGNEISKKQLIQLAIARAFLKNAPLLILDEVFATQEPDSAELLSALEKLIQNRTTLIFNQQVPQLKKIDRIVVLENGCITENLKTMDHSQLRQETRIINH
ncbi:ABC transporter transmembrane domain-containing protein [Nitrosomonas ureae]|uniref:ATP-binding cassette, subfamily B, MsbA n=1 Tax=Nitrosomonas ureae TaxID=44577 RepID=A0A1H2DTJ9_9PROT|nr:ABC transporter transmembrane domain-containing protein [Nitrosomonas ureae]ALQ50502.1 ABC transporter [Nitrosomonas ureae]SDT86195.1 ATP-binding cassette, subfamily B, MsbA [Nitrosomonas ureae]